MDRQQSIFDLEVKEKKAQKNLYRSKTGGRRSAKKGMFAFDYMTAQQRKEYAKGGEITVTNIYDQILSKEEYSQLDDQKKKIALEHWRKIHSVKAIKEALGFSDYNIYKEYERLGIEVQKRAPRKRKATAAAAAEKKAAPKKQPAADQIDEKEEAKSEVIQAAQEVAAAALQILPARNTGSTFYLDDIFTPEEAISKLMKYAAFLEGEPHKVKIRLEISEIKD